MFGGLGNMAGMLKNFEDLQGRMKEMQETLVTLRFDAESGGGAVSATVNGKMELIGIKITPETVSGGDVEMLEDLIKSAVAAAQRKAADGVKEEASKLTGGMNIPGLDGLLGGGQ